MNTTSWDTRDLGDSYPQPDFKTAYTCGVRRAATITLTGHNSPRLIHHRKMDRPSSRGMDTQLNKNSWTIASPSGKCESPVIERNPRPRSMIVLPRDDPFVIDCSDRTDSIESSDNGDSAQSDCGRDASNTELSTPATEPEEQVIMTKHTTLSPDLLASFPVLKPRPVSMSVIAATASAHVSYASSPQRWTPGAVPQTPRAYQLTPPRMRPASVAVINLKSATPTSMSAPKADRQSLTPRHRDLVSESPASYDSSPVIKLPATPQTPLSMMRRLSRRLSATPSEQSTPGSYRQSSHFESPTKPSSLRRSSSHKQNASGSSRPVSLKNGNTDMTTISPVALPSTEQLANIDRWSLQQHTQIMRTPPQIRARNASAPRAASGARRYGMFPDFDALDGDGFRLTEEDDTLDEGEINTPAKPETQVLIANDDQYSQSKNPTPDHLVSELPAPQSPLGRNSTLRRSATKRMSMIGSRFSSSKADGLPRSTEIKHSQKAERKGGFCTIM